LYFPFTKSDTLKFKMSIEIGYFQQFPQLVGDGRGWFAGQGGAGQLFGKAGLVAVPAPAPFQTKGAAFSSLPLFRSMSAKKAASMA
jgi:hypothetical protein